MRFRELAPCPDRRYLPVAPRRRPLSEVGAIRSARRAARVAAAGNRKVMTVGIVTFLRECISWHSGPPTQATWRPNLFAWANNGTSNSRKELCVQEDSERKKSRSLEESDRVRSVLQFFALRGLRRCFSARRV